MNMGDLIVGFCFMTDTILGLWVLDFDRRGCLLVGDLAKCLLRFGLGGGELQSPLFSGASSDTMVSCVLLEYFLRIVVWWSTVW